MTASSPQTRLQKLLPDGSAVISHDVEAWASISFSGERHSMIVNAGECPNFTERMATFDMDVTISGWIIVDVEVSLQNDGQYKVDVLLVED